MNLSNGTAEPIDTIPADTYYSLRISPDGRQVAAANGEELRVYRIDNGRPNVLATGISPGAGYAVWDPVDGSRIAFVRGDNVWMSSSDGTGEPRQITDLPGRVHPDAWSPDGTTIVTHQHSTRRALAVHLNENEATVVDLFDRDFIDIPVDFSPDGNWIVHRSNKSGESVVNVTRYPDPGEEFAVSPPGCDMPRWRGPRVFFQCDDRIMATDVTTAPMLNIGMPEVVYDGPFFVPGPYFSLWDATRDGQRLLILQSEDSSETFDAEPDQVNVVLNWFEDLKQRVPADGN